MRLLITGSRSWTNRRVIEAAIATATWRDSPNVIVVHGAARGADTLAGEVARERDLLVEEHPADWGRFGKRAGYIRNQEMALLGADVCLAFPLGESKGTRMMMMLAMMEGIPVIDLGDLHG